MVTAVTGLVERDAELAFLRATFSDPSGRVVLVEGEAGSGKTELLRAAIADGRERRNGIDVLYGTCEALEIPTGFAPLYEMFGDLPNNVASMITEGAEPLAIYATVLELLRARPIVLAIDDVHWADAATIGLLRYLGRRIVDTPSTLVIASRTDELDETGDVSELLAELGRVAQRVTLQPLTVQGIRTLADDAQVDADALLSTSGGNPFFVVELLREPHVEVPRTVGEVITARLRRLPIGAQRLVEGIALCPDGLELDVALRLSVDANAHIDDGCTCGLLTIDRDRVRCRHDIVRTSTDRSMGPIRRRELHAQLLELLEPRAAGPADIARLAEHASGAGNDFKTAEYSLRAADDACRAGTHRQAADHFVRALALSEFIPLDQVDDALRRAINEFELVGDPQRALATAHERVRRTKALGDVAAHADALAQLGSCALDMGDSEGAMNYARECLRVALPTDSRSRAVAARLIARLLIIDGDWNRSAAQAMTALDAARTSGDLDLETRARITAGTALEALGDEHGLEMLREAFETAAAHDLHEAAAHALNNLASSFNSEGRVDEARRAFQAGIDFCAARELDSWVASMRGGLAQAELHGGNWCVALEQLASAIGPTHCWGGASEAAMVALVIELRSHGCTADAVDVVLEHHDGGNSPWERLEAMRLACEATWQGVFPEDRARERYVRGLDDPAFRTDVFGFPRVAFWSIRLGFELPVSLPFPLPEPVALELAGDISGAAAAWDRLGCPFEAALVRVRLADPPIDEITRALEGLGAEASLAAVRRDLRARGFDVGVTTERVHPSQLTPRQLDVLALLDEGLSNADISDRLYISEKTAGHHVSAILMAFGVPSRGAAVAHARANAWI